MAVYLKTKKNPESDLDEVVEVSVIPRVKRPTTLGEGEYFFDTVDPTFITEWYKYYVVDGQLMYNPERVSIEAGRGV